MTFTTSTGRSRRSRIGHLFRELWFQVVLGAVLGIVVGLTLPAVGTALKPLNDYMIVGVMMLTSKGTAGIAGGAFIVLASTLTAVGGIPLATLALIVGIDRILNEGRVFINVLGNASPPSSSASGRTTSTTNEPARCSAPGTRSSTTSSWTTCRRTTTARPHWPLPGRTLPSRQHRNRSPPTPGGQAATATDPTVTAHRTARSRSTTGLSWRGLHPPAGVTTRASPVRRWPPA